MMKIVRRKKEWFDDELFWRERYAFMDIRSAGALLPRASTARGAPGKGNGRSLAGVGTIAATGVLARSCMKRRSVKLGPCVRRGLGRSILGFASAKIGNS
jgi:hypothetical protein